MPIDHPIATSKYDAAMPLTSFRQDISHYLSAGFAALYVTTHEETRAEKEIIEAAKENERGAFIWSLTKGWQGVEITGGKNNKPRSMPKANDAWKALEAIDAQNGLPEENVFVFRDLHPFLDAAENIRKIRDLISFCKGTGRTMIFESPLVRVPVELEKDVTVIDFALPTKDELGSILDLIVSSVGERKAQVSDRSRLLEAGRGLTWTEAENTFALALVKHKALNDNAIATVQHEKANIIKKTGILEFYEPGVTLDNVGGLNELKSWTRKRKKAFSDKARAYGLPYSRGVVLVGVQGCGKSLSAKATAAEFGIPLLRFDVGRAFQGIVGESEANMRHALAIADAIAPCVLWFDEMEKGLSGLQSSSHTDGGVSARVFGTLLTWMSERKTPVYVFATVNDIDKLPPELVRKGRFDEIFFVDLPHELERRDIFEIAIGEMKRDPKKFNLEKMAREADLFSGAEIKESVISAMFNAFDNDGEEVTSQHILDAIIDTSPLAKTHEAVIGKLRERAKDAKWRNATTVVDKVEAARRIAVPKK
jgi:ATP-dependent 26S proteasome regulatory subunit